MERKFIITDGREHVGMFTTIDDAALYIAGRRLTGWWITTIFLTADAKV